MTISIHITNVQDETQDEKTFSDNACAKFLKKKLLQSAHLTLMLNE